MTTSKDQIETRSKKVRGMAQESLDLVAAMHAAAEQSQPITGRGIGYKLFTRGLISSMGVLDMQRVYRLLRIARERGEIPWEWIVDETRQIEQKRSTWADPAAYVRAVHRSYKRDFWAQQPKRVVVASEIPCSTILASAFWSCTASAARPRSTISPMIMMDAR
jgi:hypothetical protein